MNSFGEKHGVQATLPNERLNEQKEEFAGNQQQQKRFEKSRQRTVTPLLNHDQEIVENKNVAAVIIGVCIIVAASIVG
ncbi:MAG: DUF350 domain-containing protein [Verrucomicrobia bacterium]|nr:DUF350 domain-containing protein [Verrucomicrobiota bacterium]